MIGYKDIFPSNVVALTTLKDMDFFLHPEQNDMTAEQKKYISNKINLPISDVANIRQVHGKRVIAADLEYVKKGVAEEADALITDVINLPIVIRTADCIPLFLYDKKKLCIAVIHAGWKSSRLNIVHETISQMKKKWKTKPKDLIAVFGPSILKCCYSVENEFIEYFPDFIANIDGKLMLDLPAVNKKQLYDEGLLAENIHDLNLCTFCSEECFSYRKGNKTSGRMLSLMMLI